LLDSLLQETRGGINQLFCFIIFADDAKKF